MELDHIQKTIEKFEKPRQVEVLKILVKHDIKVTENKNGIFVNLTTLDPVVISDIKTYLNHIQSQETTLQNRELKQNEYTKQYFS